MTFTLKARNTALVLIDLQHGIVGLPLQPYPADAVVRESRSMAAAFRAKGAGVVYVHVDLANMLPLLVDMSRADSGQPIPAMASELVTEAGCQAGDLIILKRHWSAFGMTDLRSALHERGVDTIVLAGIATNFGVESTAREATSLGLQVVIAEDACSSVDADAHQFAMTTIFPRIGRVRRSAAIINALT